MKKTRNGKTIEGAADPVQVLAALAARRSPIKQYTLLDEEGLERGIDEARVRAYLNDELDAWERVCLFQDALDCDALIGDDWVARAAFYVQLGMCHIEGRALQ